MCAATMSHEHEWEMGVLKRELVAASASQHHKNISSELLSLMTREFFDSFHDRNFPCMEGVSTLIRALSHPCEHVSSLSPQPWPDVLMTQ